ncbi:MAG: hypothetical protein IKE47_00855 [Oscillospiraceae bacterium]|nr:hypothetical protein [Oscillospiraceae bacterium]
MTQTMKRNLILSVLCLICALLLIGCGNASPADVPAPSQPAETAAPSAALPDANLEPVGEPTPFEIAQGFIDRPLEELVAAIGEPLSSVYGPSCLIPGGQDGQLQYDGFWIYSVKDGEMETVKDVLEGEA